jgi:hypothetical protein
MRAAFNDHAAEAVASRAAEEGADTGPDAADSSTEDDQDRSTGQYTAADQGMAT